MLLLLWLHRRRRLTSASYSLLTDVLCSEPPAAVGTLAAAIRHPAQRLAVERDPSRPRAADVRCAVEMDNDAISVVEGNGLGSEMRDT